MYPQNLIVNIIRQRKFRFGIIYYSTLRNQNCETKLIFLSYSHTRKSFETRLKDINNAYKTRLTTNDVLGNPEHKKEL